MTFLAGHAGGPPYRGVPTAPGSFFPKKRKKEKKIAKSDTRGATLARAAGSLWLAGPRQLARAHRLPLVTHLAACSAGLSAGSGNAAPFPLRPGVARHQSRSRRDRGSVASFSITAHSAGPT